MVFAAKYPTLATFNTPPRDTCTCAYYVYSDTESVVSYDTQSEYTDNASVETEDDNCFEQRSSNDSFGEIFGMRSFRNASVDAR